MNWRVTVQPDAQRDLLSITSYISRDSMIAAAKVTARLEAAVLERGTVALQYPVVARYSNEGVRRRVVGSHNIYFRVTEKTVDVLRVVHGARDVVRLLPEDG